MERSRKAACLKAELVLDRTFGLGQLLSNLGLTINLPSPVLCLSCFENSLGRCTPEASLHK